MATQNPIEQEGTYPLPEAQRDVVFICDPLEADLPGPGRYPVSDGRQVFSADCRDVSLRRDFALNFHRHRESVTAMCRRYGLHFITMGTHQSMVENLRAELF